ncbi:MAG: SPASM domain-containing protein, partial [Nitrospirae bacterium]|nr:SPASM domain-containing protein [Nitrospirota bacterium]
EPTTNPEIVGMVEYAKKKGIKEVWVNTNGGLLTEKMAEGLISAGLDCLTVSFDGLGEIYESIRVPLKYEDTLARLKMFMNVRKKLGAKKPIVKVQTLWSAIKNNPDEYLNIMANIVDKVSYNIDFDFKDIHFRPDPDYVCYRLWQRIAITSGGDVLKCPSDFEKEEILGNVNTDSIKQLWDTTQQQERQRHLSGRRLESAVCKKCHHGAKVEKDAKVYSDKHQEVNAVVYNGGFEGVGLNRQKKAGK